MFMYRILRDKGVIILRIGVLYNYLGSWDALFLIFLIFEWSFVVDVWNKSYFTFMYRNGVGVKGTLQTLFYAEVTDQMKVSSGGGLLDEGEQIEVIELSNQEALKCIMDETITKPVGMMFAFTWFFFMKDKEETLVLRKWPVIVYFNMNDNSFFSLVNVKVTQLHCPFVSPLKNRFPVLKFHCQCLCVYKVLSSVELGSYLIIIYYFIWQKTHDIKIQSWK